MPLEIICIHAARAGFHLRQNSKHVPNQAYVKNLVEGKN